MRSKPIELALAHNTRRPQMVLNICTCISFYCHAPCDSWKWLVGTTRACFTIELVLCLYSRFSNRICVTTTPARLWPCLCADFRDQRLCLRPTTPAQWHHRNIGDVLLVWRRNFSGLRWEFTGIQTKNRLTIVWQRRVTTGGDLFIDRRGL